MRQTVGRLLHRGDDDSGSHQYTFLHGGRDRACPGFRPREAFPDFVRSVLARHGIGHRPTIFWVYPTNDVLPGGHRRARPRRRRGRCRRRQPHLARRGLRARTTRRFERNYGDVLARSDLVLANCEPVAEAHAGFAPEVHVVPNGCELPSRRAARPVPGSCERLSGPIIGYVGNLSQRLDIPLLERSPGPTRRGSSCSSARPTSTGRSFGSTGSRTCTSWASSPTTRRCGSCEHFDVALIPHRRQRHDAVDEPAQGLRLLRGGRPGGVDARRQPRRARRPDHVAEGPTEFAAAIEDALRAGRREPDLDALRPHSWERRIEQVIG